MGNENTFYGLISELEKYLEYQRDQGVVRVEVDRSVLDELKNNSVQQTESTPVPVVEARPVPSDFDSLAAIKESIASCKNCGLCQGRKTTVPGEGNGNSPDILFVGEGPGAEEDAQGRPFVGKAGQLLDRMIEAMGYRREDVFITNVVKCRPPSNRKPLPEEMEMCLPYLRQQIKLIKPKVIVGLGASAMEGLLGKPVRISRIRGIWQEYEGIRLMPTFHPSYLLRDPSKKKSVWTDLKLVLAELGKEPAA